MQLRNRIKKVEKDMGISRSQYCVCHGVIKIEALPMTIAEWKRRADAGEETLLPLPVNCPDCGKPYDRRFIEETFSEHKAKVDARMSQALNTWNMHQEIEESL